MTLVVDTSADNDICVVHERSTDKASVVQGNSDARKTLRIGLGSELQSDLEFRVRIDFIRSYSVFFIFSSSALPLLGAFIYRVLSIVDDGWDMGHMTLL